MTNAASDHERIIQGRPHWGPPERECPPPIRCEEWRPEPRDLYPTGPWQQVSFKTGSKDDHGGARNFWVHIDYFERMRQRRYCSLPPDRLSAKSPDDGRLAQGYPEQDKPWF